MAVCVPLHVCVDMCWHVCTQAQVYLCGQVCLCVCDQEQVNMGAWQPLGENRYRYGRLIRKRIKNPLVSSQQDQQPRWTPCVPWRRRLRFTFKNGLILLFLQDQRFQFFLKRLMLQERSG